LTIVLKINGGLNISYECLNEISQYLIQIKYRFGNCAAKLFVKCILYFALKSLIGVKGINRMYRIDGIF